MGEVALMAMEIPKAEKVYTTTYENFRGVDFTNDPSNVWYRRTPDGVNMLPDEAGRPFKRTGWEKVVTADDFAQKYYDDNHVEPIRSSPVVPEVVKPSEISIRKCYYFELAGEDHLVIFTNYGVFIYREGELLSYPISYDKDLIESWERAYFFEGNGKAGFYIYGGYKIWEYAYDDNNGYTWQEVAPYIPRVNISVDARHESGTSYEAINMLSDYIAESFQNNIFGSVSATTTVSSATVTVNETAFLAMLPEAGSYVFTYTNADHTWLLAGDQVQISNYGISLDKSPADGNTITATVVTNMRINLPKRVLSIDGMEVWVSNNTEFDTELTLQATEAHQTSGYVTLVTPQSGNSYLKFYAPYMPLVDGEDAIKVVYPRNAVSSTTHEITQTITVGA